eukprot:Rhum_TRINITY_DN7900_c0_g1::Rhum_TRINITY_DN7900_c0_g1_i1::g.25102::m.25102
MLLSWADLRGTRSHLDVADVRHSLVPLRCRSLTVLPLPRVVAALPDAACSQEGGEPDDTADDEHEQPPLLAALAVALLLDEHRRLRRRRLREEAPAHGDGARVAALAPALEVLLEGCRRLQVLAQHAPLGVDAAAPRCQRVGARRPVGEPRRQALRAQREGRCGVARHLQGDDAQAERCVGRIRVLAEQLDGEGFAVGGHSNPLDTDEMGKGRQSRKVSKVVLVRHVSRLVPRRRLPCLKGLQERVRVAQEERRRRVVPAVLVLELSHPVAQRRQRLEKLVLHRLRRPLRQVVQVPHAVQRIRRRVGLPQRARRLQPHLLRAVVALDVPLRRLALLGHRRVEGRALAVAAEKDVVAVLLREDDGASRHALEQLPQHGVAAGDRAVEAAAACLDAHVREARRVVVAGGGDAEVAGVPLPQRGAQALHAGVAHLREQAGRGLGEAVARLHEQLAVGVPGEKQDCGHRHVFVVERTRGRRREGAEHECRTQSHVEERRGEERGRGGRKALTSLSVNEVQIL